MKIKGAGSQNFSTDRLVIKLTEITQQRIKTETQKAMETNTKKPQGLN